MLRMGRCTRTCKAHLRHTDVELRHIFTFAVGLHEGLIGIPLGESDKEHIQKTDLAM